MARPSISTKRVLIDKANSKVVIAAGAAAFIVIFSAVAIKTLASQAGYQNRVISAKRATYNQLQTNIEAVNTLKQSYDKFDSANPNILGGTGNLGNGSSGSGLLDGTNSKIVLDSLPSAYDFPALANSIERLIGDQGLSINSITGVDDAVAQTESATSSSPQPVPIPFQIAVEGDYQKTQNLISAFQKSIRPIQVQSITVTAGENSQLVTTVNAQTFYQPAKSLNISTEVIK